MFASHGWVSSTILYATLLLLPILLYVFFYQGSRIDEATMRNFRSLGTAADRIEETLGTFRRISRNYSLGIDSTLLKDINDACKDDKHTWLSTSIDLLGVVQKTRNQSVLKRKLKTKAVRRQSSPSLIECGLERFKVDTESCEQGVRFGQSKLFSHDCRELRERDRRVYDALRPPKANDESNDGKDANDVDEKDGAHLIAILDQFGIEVSMDTKEALDEPTRHLSAFFDNYFIANGSGDVIFAGDATPYYHDEHRRHRTEAPFASLASIKDLLVEPSPRPFAFLERTNEQNANSNVDLPQTGHSTVRDVEVDGVDLSIFIQPFSVDSSKLYVVGVVLRSSLVGEAVRLRLGPAVDATITIAILLTLLPILRFWIGGDRSILRRFNLYSVGASVFGAAALCTALVSGIVFKSIDSQALNNRLASISIAVIEKFNNEIRALEDGLEGDFRKMNDALNDKRDQPCPPENYPEGENKNTIERAIFCRSICRLDKGRHWWPTSSYLLDDEGKRVLCMQHREDEPLKLDLSFRNYFTEAARNKLSLYRIDSAVRGEKQTVASRDYSTKKQPDRHRVAVAIQKLLSIDGAVLPPHFQYAVIDRSGRTLFHSDEDRVSISNFIDDTGNDARVQAAINYGQGVTLDLGYDGVPIRAHLARIHDEVDWTLVVFRSHSLVDRISSLAVSLSMFFWFVTTFFIFIFLALLVVVPRPHGKELLPAVILSGTDIGLGLIAAVWAGLGFLTIYIFNGNELVVVGLLWPVVITIIVYVLAWRRLDTRRASTVVWSERQRGVRCPGAFRATACTDRGKSFGFRAFTFASLVFSFSVIPVLTWHTYFRVQLSNGLAEHLKVEILKAIEDRKRDFDRHTRDLVEGAGGDEVLQPFLEDSVVGFGGTSGEDLIRIFMESADVDGDTFVACGERSFWFCWLWSTFAYSPVTQQAMWYGSKVPALEGIRSISDAVNSVAGHRSAGSHTETRTWHWLVIASGTVFILFLCCLAVRTKFGHIRHIGQLRSFFLGDEIFSSATIRLQLVKRSERDVERMIEALRPLFSIKVLGWNDAGIVWGDLREDRSIVTGISENKRRVFLVRDLRGAVEKGGTELAEELASVADNDAIVLCSDVVPFYHLSSGSRTGPMETETVWGSEWRELMGRFDVGVLRGDSLGVGNGKMWSGVPTVDELLTDELRANADLESVVLRIGETLRNYLRGLADEGRRSGFDDGDRRWRLDSGKWRRSAPTEGQLREKALRDFRVAAQGRFKTLWAVSSFDEKAQLYALAHGGGPNMRRPAAISSLVARGLITEEDPMQLCSEAFGEFIVEDLDDSLDDWRRKGQGDWWRGTWLPVVLLAGLGLLFFINSNPEAIGVIAAIGAAFIGLVPVFMSVFRTGQFVQPTFSSNDE